MRIHYIVICLFTVAVTSTKCGRFSWWWYWCSCSGCRKLRQSLHHRPQYGWQDHRL